MGHTILSIKDTPPSCLSFYVFNLAILYCQWGNLWRYRYIHFINWKLKFTLLWRHNGRDGVSNHHPYSTVYSGADQRKHQSPASLAFVRGIHRSAVNSPHKGPVTRKMFLFHDVIMNTKKLNSVHNLVMNCRLWRLLICSQFCVIELSSKIIYNLFMSIWSLDHGLISNLVKPIPVSNRGLVLSTDLMWS